MTDVFPPEKRSEIMRRIRPRNTGPERRIGEWLSRRGVGYVYQAKVGRWRADFLIPDRKLIIEYRDCFWHLCPRCHPDGPPVKGGMKGREWWAGKLTRNRERDLLKERAWREMGFKVEVIWGHEDVEERLKEVLAEGG